MLNPVGWIKNRLQQSSQHFQVALQVLDLKPWKIKRMIETGFALYQGTEKAKNPLFLHIEPTGMCNLKCTMCPRTESITREMKHMSYENFTKILDGVNPIIVALVGFGEPLMNPHTLNMVRYAVKKGVTTRISSNATMLNSQRSQDILRTGLHQIWFSVDSPTAQNFEKIRVGAKFEKTVEAIKEFLELRRQLKSKTVVTVNFTITKDNMHELGAMVEFCHEHFKEVVPTFARGYGYDLQVQQARALQNTAEIQGYLQEAVAKAQMYKLFELEHNLQTIMNDLTNPLDGKGPCYFPYYVVAVSWDGKVSPCCLFYDYQMNLGNVHEKSFNEIWNGKAYQNFRMKLKSRRADINICNTCPLNDVSLHNMMHVVSKVPGMRFFTKEKYAPINRQNVGVQTVL